MRMECPHCDKWADFTPDHIEPNCWVCEECEAVIKITPKKKGEAKLKESK